MEPFPFTQAEWDAVRRASLAVASGRPHHDLDPPESRPPGLREVLAGLRVRYGEHPVLLETEADLLTDDDAERVALYQRAADIAAALGLPTRSIRLSLAESLLDLDRRAAAVAELAACERELPDGDEWERQEWAELVARAGDA